MSLGDIESALRVAASALGERGRDVGLRGVPPHHVAYLRLASAFDPADYAEVSVSASGWLCLEIPGGFTYNTLVELDDEEEVRGSLQRLMTAAGAYLDGRSSKHYSRFSIPHVKIETVDGPLSLGLSIRGQLVSMFRAIWEPSRSG